MAHLKADQRQALGFKAGPEPVTGYGLPAAWRLTANRNLPILLTWLRIAFIPLLVLVFYSPFAWSRPVSALIFAVGGATDWLDGFLARRWNQISAFGAFLDPVADKLMVTVALVMLVEDHATPWLAVPAIIIIGREIAVSALREWMAEIGHRGVVAVSLLAKVKTASQMLALWLLLFHVPMFGLPVRTTGFVLIYVAAGLTVWSMVLYLRAAGRATAGG